MNVLRASILTLSFALLLAWLIDDNPHATPASALPLSQRATATPIPTPTPLPQRLAVTTTADVAPCPAGPGNPGYSLRCAVTQANEGNPGRTIAFAIPPSDPGCGPTQIHGQAVPVCTISLTHALPALSAGSTMIDGYSQPGASPNSATSGGDNAVLTIRLDGALVAQDGLSLSSVSGVVIQGLAITNFHKGAGITASNSDHITITGNLIGIGSNGSPQGNAVGVQLSRDSSVLVGGTTPAATNIIGDNAEDGIALTSSTGSVVAGNLIGTDITGEAQMGNGTGVLLTDVGNTVIGGTVGVARNVISGNSLDGLSIANGTQDLVQGNDIGTDQAGTAPLGNGAYGVALTQYAKDVTIEQNIIAYNSQAGIHIGATPQNSALPTAIHQNSILQNKRLGIDIVPTRESNCAMTRSNNQLVVLHNEYHSTTCPVIRTATDRAISGTACRECTVDVYIATDSENDQGFGEGSVYLGSVIAHTGKWTLKLRRGVFDASHQQVTATSTTSGSSPATSEFTLDMPVRLHFQSLNAHYLTKQIRSHGRSQKVRMGLRFTWKMARQTGIAGFDVYAGTQRLNPAFIRPADSQTYDFSQRLSQRAHISGALMLAVLLQNGVTVRVTVKPI